MIILILVACLLALMGVMVKYLKWYWLISGYNTASAEEKKNIDIVGLSRHLGNTLFLNAGILLLSVILHYLRYQVASTWFLMSMFIIIAYLIITAQKYNLNQKSNAQVIIIVVGIILVSSLVSGLLFYGSREPLVVVGANTITVSGIYGLSVPVESITAVELKKTIPAVIRKTNGFDLGNILKGNFKLQEVGQSKLYVNMAYQPYIYIFTKNTTLIINFKDAEKTRQLYQKIKTAIQ